MADFVVGLTGGIASGKSEVSRRFEALGIVVVDADIAAREVVALGSEGLSEIVTAFGSDVLSSDGTLDRAAMRRRVFADETARRQLEGIIHPRVRARLQTTCAAAPTPYAIAAVPLLAEGGAHDTYPWLHRILIVDVSVTVQHARLLQRDGIDDTLASKMIAAQATREQRFAIADDIVVNDGDLRLLDTRISALDKSYRYLAKP